MKVALAVILQLLLYPYITNTDSYSQNRFTTYITDIANACFLRSELHIFSTEETITIGRPLLPTNHNSIFQTVMKYFTKKIKWTLVIYNELKEIVPEQEQVKNPKVQNLMMILENIAELETITNVLKQSRILNYGSVLLVIVPSKDETKVFDILYYLWEQLRAINATVMTVDHNREENIQFYSWFPYNGSKRAVDLGSDVKYIFPNKIPYNLKGYPIVAGVDYLEPYVMPPLSPGEYKEGVEIYVLNSLAEFFNMTVIYRTSPPGANSRVVYVKGQTSGLFGMLNKRKADIALAGMMRNPDRFAASECLFSHTEDQLKWSFPKPLQIVSWASLYRAFALEIWLLILILVLINSAIVSILNSFYREEGYGSFTESLLSVWGVTLDLGFFQAPRTTVLRVFTGFVFFYAMVISCSYKSCLTTFLTRPSYEPPITSIEEALEKGLNLRFHSSSKQSQSADDIWQRILLPGRHFYSQSSVENLGHVAINRTSLYLAIYFATEFLQIEHFLDDAGKPLIKYFKDRFNTFSTSFFMSPGHPMENLFNEKIAEMIQAGLISHELQRILDTEKRKTMINRYRSTTKRVEISLGPKALNFEELRIVFIGGGLALLVCFIVYLLEWSINAYLK